MHLLKTHLILNCLRVLIHSSFQMAGPKELLQNEVISAIIFICQLYCLGRWVYNVLEGSLKKEVV